MVCFTLFFFFVLTHCISYVFCYCIYIVEFPVSFYYSRVFISSHAKFLSPFPSSFNFNFHLLSFAFHSSFLASFFLSISPSLPLHILQRQVLKPFLLPSTPFITFSLSLLPSLPVSFYVPPPLLPSHLPFSLFSVCLASLSYVLFICSSFISLFT